MKRTNKLLNKHKSHLEKIDKGAQCRWRVKELCVPWKTRKVFNNCFFWWEGGMGDGLKIYKSSHMKGITLI